MAVSWTDAQKSVIDSRGGNLLVSAAAGSGKTAVLVERIIQMITDSENPVDIDRLLVMTFTKAAASEMKERIQAAIDKKLIAEPENSRLKRQSVMVDYAQITTIDSFCLNLIREHFDMTELDPGFRVADEGEMLLLKGEVMEQLLEQEYEIGRESFKAFVEAYSSGKTDMGIQELIESVYNYAQSFPWPYEWFEEQLSEAKKEDEALSSGRIMEFLLEDSKRLISDWIMQLKAFKSICEESDGPEKYLPAIMSDIAEFEHLLEVSDSYEKLSQAMNAVEFVKLAVIRNNASGIDMDKKARVQAGRDTIKKFHKKLLGQYFYDTPENIAHDMKLGNIGVIELLNLAKAFTSMLDEAKRERNIVDFSDLEHFALKVLIDENKQPTLAADEMAEEFAEILVDEYQDSNYVQETLIQALSAERFGRPDVFMVGDVKQSIYQFRQARPEIFLEKYNRYPQYAVSGGSGNIALNRETSKKDKKIELHQNFRSRSEVLGSINDVFYGLMREEIGGVQYTDEAALYVGADYKDTGCYYGTELMIANTDTDSDEDLTSKELEASMIAGKIKEITDPETGLMVFDKDQGVTRRAEYSDVVILLRSLSGFAEEFSEVLGRHGIPAVSEKKTGYFATEEIELVLSLLSIIDNPMQDISFTAVLKSPFAGFTDAELAEIAAYYKGKADSKVFGFYSQLKDYITFAEGNIREKGENLLAMLADFEKKAVYMPMHELLYYIFDVTDYYRYASALPGGQVRKANLDMLVEKASAYENTSYRGVFNFIRYIEKLKKYDTDFGEATVTGGTGAVRIMSIHKSKGLEFPIIFLAGSAKRFNKMDLNARVVIDNEYGIGSDYTDIDRRIKGTTIKKNVVKKRREYSDLGEELRILYVAMTRAKEKLFITAAVNKPDEKIEKLGAFAPEGRMVPAAFILSASSYFDWIVMSSYAGAVRIKTEIASVDSQIEAEEQEQLDRMVLKERYLALENTDALYDDVYAAQVAREQLDYVYPWTSDINLRIKYSVSDLKKKDYEAALEEDEGIVPVLPHFMSEVEESTGGGAGRGTAYHRVFELIDYCGKSDTGFIKSQIDSMVESGKLSSEEAKLVNHITVKKLLDSSLGRRMLKACECGKLYRERQFVIGFPACEILDTESKEYMIIQGIIDGYFEEDGEIVLLDYKTDSVKAPEELVSRYKTQLDLYDKALSQLTGMKVKERIIYSTRFGEINL